MLELIKTSVAEVRPDIDGAWLTAETEMKGDLSMTSIELINVLALITQATGKQILYEPLLVPGGVPRSELTLGALAAFIEAEINSPSPAVMGA